MKKLIATLLIGGMSISMIGCTTSSAEGIKNGSTQEATILADSSQVVEASNEGELFIGKIISSETKKDADGKEIRIVKAEGIFGIRSIVEIIIDKDTRLENNETVGFSKDYLISIFYNKEDLKEGKDGKVTTITAKVLCAVEKDQVIKIDPIEVSDEIFTGQIVGVETKKDENAMTLRAVEKEQASYGIEGELFIGKIISSESKKDKNGSETHIIKTEGIFGLSEEVEVIIDDSTVVDNLTTQGFTKDYLIGIYYDQDGLILGKKGQPTKVIAKALSSVEKDQSITIDPIEMNTTDGQQ